MSTALKPVPLPETPPPGTHWLRRLIGHIRVLGFWLGLRYWRIERACLRDPQKVVEWARRCDKEGKRCYERGDMLGAMCMWAWANELRASHRAYVVNDLEQLSPK